MCLQICVCVRNSVGAENFVILFREIVREGELHKLYVGELGIQFSDFLLVGTGLVGHVLSAQVPAETRVAVGSL